MMRYPTRPGVPSENGWPMITSADTVSVQVVPAAKACRFRAGPVATIMNAWIIYYDRHIERIRSQVWAYSSDNDVANSNHMSGTAADIHAPWYGMGVRNMPAPIVAKVEDGMRKFGPALYWGGWWNYPDQMHYQIGLPPTDPRVQQLADRLDAGYLGIYGPAPTTPPAPGKDAPMSAAEVNEIKKYVADYITGYVGPIGSDVKDVRYQLTGSRDLVAPGGKINEQASYPGLDMLGGLTPVEALAALGYRAGITGFIDPITGARR
jgi:hypothetical protein